MTDHGHSEESISCVIPTHARSTLLREALDSVTQQTQRPMEVLVVSDVEDELTREVVREFSQLLNVRLLRSPGSGASQSRNFGVENSNGTIIAFLDDDDVWMPRHLELGVTSLTLAQADAAVTWFDVFEGSSVHEGERISQGLHPRDVIAKNWGSTGSNLLIRRDAFGQVGGFDPELKTKNDTDFFYRVLESGASYAVVSEVTMLQRKHPGTQLTDRTEKRAAGNEMYLRKHRANLRWRDRRDLRLAIHRIRRSTAASPLARLGHTILAAANYSPRKYFEERALRQRQRNGQLRTLGQ